MDKVTAKELVAADSSPVSPEARLGRFIVIANRKGVSENAKKQLKFPADYQYGDAKPGQIVGLFQIGAQATHVSVLQNGETIHGREQPFGGNQLTQDIVRAYGLSFEDAETRKRSGELPENYRADLLAPFLESAALEVTRAIQFFFTSTPYTRIDQLYLAGGCAALPGLLELIGSRTRHATSGVAMMAPTAEPAFSSPLMKALSLGGNHSEAIRDPAL